ncbi:Ig-like domain-containing protein [Sphingobium yanoikuyae]|uniref:Ig-like domain-containing protein n=1 Tax=Sphingobium yanoikuyae TaxID=13690 RepID=UPI0035AEF77D
MAAEIIDKSSGEITQTSAEIINLDRPSVVRLDLARGAVENLQQKGNNLLIHLSDGRQVQVFYFHHPSFECNNSLVLRENDGSQWRVRSSGRLPNLSILNDIDELLGAASAASSGSSLVLPALISGIGFAGIAATDSNDDADTDADTDAPAPPTASLNGTGTICSGTAEANATVKIRTADGTLIGSGTADADGNYAIDLDMPQYNGETVLVTQIDEAGNVSQPAAANAPDLTAPTSPDATLETTTSISGTGEPGAIITVYDAAGSILGTSQVEADGTYQVALGAPQNNGERLTVSEVNAAGIVSDPVFSNSTRRHSATSTNGIDRPGRADHRRHGRTGGQYSLLQRRRPIDRHGRGRGRWQL